VRGGQAVSGLNRTFGGRVGGVGGEAG